MAALFYKVLGMSATASAVILLVLLVRLFLRRAPKVFSYALWAVVLFRLLCPVTFSSPVGLVAPVQVGPSMADAAMDAPPAATVGTVSNPPVPAPGPVAGLPDSVPGPVPDTSGGTQPETPAFEPDLLTVASSVWLSGAVLLLGHGLISLLRLRRKLVGSTPLAGETGVRLADHIPSPFVLGLFRPIIYLPSGLTEGERDYILLHERTHIRRFDHIFRALAWLALAVHWFNPLVWLAFHLAGKDMEMSCDETVLRKMGRDIRADYSTSLLRLSTGKRLPAGPLAFGDSDPKGRIKNVLRWKKPALWVAAAALIVVVCAGAALASNQAGLSIDPGSAAFVPVSLPTTLGTDYDFFGRITTEDALHWEDVRQLPQEDADELIRLVNSYGKTVFRWGAQLIDGLDNWVRIDCADGGHYLFHYHYCSGFSLLHGEDDYYSLVTHYDAQGNAGTTWKMEYDFDRAYKAWPGDSVWAQPEKGTDAPGSSTDSLEPGLTLSLDDAGTQPCVKIDGSVDGVALPRGATWYPPYSGMMTKKYPYGHLSLVYPGFTGGIEGHLTAFWMDEERTLVGLSTEMMAALSSGFAGYWVFTVEPSSGTVKEMLPLSLWDEGVNVQMFPESIPDGDAVRAARVAAKLLTAAESYYSRQTAAQGTANFAPVYSMDGGEVRITGIGSGYVSCGSFYGPKSLGSLYFAGDPAYYCPRLAGGQVEGGAHWLDENTLRVTFNVNDERVVSGAVSGFRVEFAADLDGGRITEKDFQSKVEGETLELTDQEMLDMAQTLSGLIRGAADYCASTLPAPEEGSLPFDTPLAMEFCSGAGGWRTSLTLHPDGSFEGEYTDSDMGVSGEGYDSTQYICRFHGRFGDIARVTDASYSLTLAELVLDTGRPIGEEWIERTQGNPGTYYNLRYISSVPYGLCTWDGEAMEPGARFMLYTPDASGKQGGELHGMENEFSSLNQFWHWWPNRYAISAGSGGTLGCYGLHNLEINTGFFS